MNIRTLRADVSEDFEENCCKGKTRGERCTEARHTSPHERDHQTGRPRDSL